MPYNRGPLFSFSAAGLVASVLSSAGAAGQKMGSSYVLERS